MGLSDLHWWREDYMTQLVLAVVRWVRTKLVKWVRNEYSAARENSKFSKHHFHRACPRVVTIDSTATTSNFSANFWRIGSRFHWLWRVFSPIFLWSAWHHFYSRRQWFGIWRHRPSRLMFHWLQYMLVCLLVCLKWEALMYVIVRLLCHLNRAAQACWHGIPETYQYLHEHVLLLRSTVNLFFCLSLQIQPHHSTRHDKTVSYA